ncbi:O-antigen ligase family protein [Streptomyces neyagawaensis]|uniref:O-antigen ligase family protein n=3 Tax=Streptomyces neyagawaensis TaxID=42238 RepID=UPI00201CC247|nr:O-antigen ligase family protein [Streptomyces neyagawaensis]MCL6733479.1 O-antigen ligase family protein [Streptomyces neyagawaensis]MDE1685292.1 O-antigen ligase family protein [Streptomyces neyagawaensis]
MLDASSSPRMQQRRPRLLLIGMASFWVLVGGNLAVADLNAPVTLAIYFAAMFALPCALYRAPSRAGRLEPVNPLRARLPLPLWGFAALAAASAVQEQTSAGVQNALVYLSFVALTALAATWTSAGSPLLLLRWVRAAAVVGALGYLTTVAFRGPGAHGFYPARVYGEVVWIGMAAAVPIAKRSRAGFVVPALLLTACLLSLSRTATAVCALMFLALAAVGRGRRELIRVVALAGVMSYAAVWLITEFQPLRNRFMENDNEAVGGFVIGTTGRSKMWEITWSSIKESPWLGHGVGDAQQLITDHIPLLTHPHNDYLRLWNDVGVIGMGLWVSAVLLLMRGAVRRWRTAATAADRAIHQAALLCLIGLSLNAFTSNSLVYIFVAVPVAVIVGTSLGRAYASNASERPTVQRNPIGQALVKVPS